MPKNTSFFCNKLIKWYLDNKRELPWRGLRDPYRVWLSEIILQQTRVAQGLPYYLKFISAYPTVQMLANAPQEEVLKLWQGLGYYSRARNLHETAKYVHEVLQGTFPENYSGLLKLRGVGDYTASAIASICYNEATAVVDGNVYRVLSRVFGIATPINSTAGTKEFKKLAQTLLYTKDAGTYNQALMEFGARYCVPQNPDCPNCIFKDRCVAYKQREVSELPVKLKKLKVKKRYFNYLVILTDAGYTLLEQRTQKGIWQQLYQFPLIESDTKLTLQALEKTEGFQKITEATNPIEIVRYNDEPVVHKLSHQHLYTWFWIVRTSNEVAGAIPIHTIKSYAVPVLVQNFIHSFFSDQELTDS